MKNLFLIPALLIAFATSSAFAQSPLPPTPTAPDFSSAFQSLTALAAMIATITAFARVNVSFVKTLEGWQVIAFSAVLGLLIGGAGQYAYPVTIAPFSSLPAPLSGIAFGLAAGLLASGSFDFLRGLLGGTTKAGGSSAGDSARGRL